MTVATIQPGDIALLEKRGFNQDPDVLDTWFSSWLWPFATMGWIDHKDFDADNATLKAFYPTTDLVTGPDIIFFWVARMLMMGLHFMGDVPFRKVLLHGMVCDESGSKMSKVKGNVIDPLDLVHGATLQEIIAHASGSAPFEEGLRKFRAAYPSVSSMKEGFPAFGADAVRFYLASHPPQSRKINLNLGRLQGYRDFCNKVWNATRFALTHIADVEPRPTGAFPQPSSAAERWILSRLAHTIAAVNQGVKEFRLDEATTAIYQFFWYELCDWFLELCKPVFSGADGAARASYKLTLAHCLETVHRLLHPFMPHLTAECWAHLPEAVRRRRSDGALPEVLALAPFPDEGDATVDPDAEARIAALQGSIEGVRRICAELGIRAGGGITVTLRTADEEARAVLKAYEPQILLLTRAKQVVHEAPSAERPRGVGFGVANGVEILIPIAGHVDVAKEKTRLANDIAKAQKESDSLSKRLGNADYVGRAPADVVAKDRARLTELADKVERLRAAVAVVGEVGD